VAIVISKDKFLKEYTVRQNSDCHCVDRESICEWHGDEIVLKWDKEPCKFKIEGAITVTKPDNMWRIDGTWESGVTVDEHCTCTEEGCCMYPAAALEIEAISWEDLPETLYGPIEDRTFTRVEPYESGGVTIYYEAPDIAGEPQTIYIDESGSPWEWNSGTVPSAGGPCLISGSISSGIEDTFSSSYTLKAVSVGGFYFGECEYFSLLDDVVLDRESTCVWSKEVEVFVFSTSPPPESPCADGYMVATVATLTMSETEWRVEIGTFGNPKSPGPQSSPVGIYGFLEIE
jgi:hypothetical protein